VIKLETVQLRVRSIPYVTGGFHSQSQVNCTNALRAVPLPHLGNKSSSSSSFRGAQRWCLRDGCNSSTVTATTLGITRKFGACKGSSEWKSVYNNKQPTSMTKRSTAKRTNNLRLLLFARTSKIAVSGASIVGGMKIVGSVSGRIGCVWITSNIIKR